MARDAGMAEREDTTGKAQTQERILAAATKLFMQEGYDRTTMAQVAEGAGVSRATVFWHFRDKAGLFREAFSRLLAPFRASLESDLSHLEPAKRLPEQMARAEKFTRDHQAEFAAFVRWAVESPVFRESLVATLLDLNQNGVDIFPL